MNETELISKFYEDITPSYSEYEEKVRGRINNFPEPYRTQLMDNVEAQGIDCRDFKDIETTNDQVFLSSLFDWDQTPQGFDYWDDFYTKLFEENT